MGEDKAVDKQVSPAVQEALDLASKANALKEQIEAADASDSDDINAVIKHLLFCINQHTLDCRQLISEIGEALAPGESSHYRRMQALEHLSQIDRLNEMLALKVMQKISASRYAEMAVNTSINGADKRGFEGVLTFPSGRLMMIDKNGKADHYIKYSDIAKNCGPAFESAFDMMAKELADVNYESANPTPMIKPMFKKWDEQP
ncbi:MAG: hypothetical protein ACRDBQ_23185 [Shewanella sp.]